ncbi:hypothetical protein KMW28_23085 [Flammeovirga yaeyamensis]|uniref:Uncharacterized protein n=1 Tax=Flammeovirga yaeyamensis TaxID=367791 RepID=A0AAX1NCM4_9BACT|nr:hypothetical protein [Flammeovirga yaeyamensis]MBB3696748.1 hypothetical protein [Flammeovirga yaeyamensis]NMF33416.1 hypothetical protein [Flammeovirga yaeyamensis]QWG05309.1 hypothetical protein KMW28_23085 [Flammeovirga yaeyamensis]
MQIINLTSSNAIQLRLPKEQKNNLIVSGNTKKHLDYSTDVIGIVLLERGHNYDAFIISEQKGEYYFFNICNSQNLSSDELITSVRPIIDQLKEIGNFELSLLSEKLNDFLLTEIDHEYQKVTLVIPHLTLIVI